MGVPERDPYLHVVEHVSGSQRSIDRPQRYTRSAQLGNPPGYSEDNPFTQEFPQPQLQHSPGQSYPQPQSDLQSRAQPQYQQWQSQEWQGQSQPAHQFPGQGQADPQWSSDASQWQAPPRQRRRPGHSDWEVCLRFPFGKLRFGGFIGWERD